ncbi:MAG TPA: hypothetical protein VLJ42_09385 [Solirubrobacteraceae bacterium]|nr:hypothetical protein [Solirubrobacteraceae bacterium]
MKTTNTLAGLSAVLIALLGTTALSASAQPAAHAGACKFGKEAHGCKLNGTGYGQYKQSVFVTFPASVSPKGSHSQLSLPSTFACAKAVGATLTIDTKQTARIGSSISFGGKAALQNSSAATALVKSAKIHAKLTLTNAKHATLSGNVKLTLADGSTCAKKLPSSLTRVLGG